MSWVTRLTESVLKDGGSGASAGEGGAADSAAVFMLVYSKFRRERRQ